MTVKNLSDYIPPHFYSLVEDFLNDRKGHYWLAGGRGSIKSTIASELIILGLLADPNAHAVFGRLHKIDLHNSIYDQVKKSINLLGVAHKFKISSADQGAPTMTIIETGQKIMFVGIDDPDGVKSMTVPFGYIKYTMWEEIQEFDGMEKIRNVNQTLRRGANIRFVTFYCYNPPRSRSNWTHDYMDSQKSNPKWHVSQSNWEMLPPEKALAWLGQDWINDALDLKEADRAAYDHEYMGIPVGYGTNVFENLDIREISKSERGTFDNIATGLDWGFANDPLAAPRCHYDRTRRVLYIFDEIYGTSYLNRETASELHQKVGRELVIADSAEPKSIAELNELGINIIGAKKGPGSIETGVKFLRELKSIVIDPNTAPNAAREFAGAEWDVDRNGKILTRLRPTDDHSIDAVRYRMEREQRRQAGWGKKETL